MTDAVRHLVAVWNPSYSASAMDEHLTVLLNWARKFDERQATEDELYVWWGKVRSPTRLSPQENAAEIREVAALGAEHEVHLHLTDYRSLYVAEVLGVADGELAESQRVRAPAYYAKDGLKCDFWFKVGDIRRLLVDDTLQVIDELRKLWNEHYNGRPMSLYGTLWTWRGRG